MFSKVSFYGYLFLQNVDTIIRYDILWRGSAKYLLKSTILNKNHENSSEEIMVMVFENLRGCLHAILGRLRNHEVEMGLYKNLNPETALPQVYDPLVDKLEDYITKKAIGSFSFFGNLLKYPTRSDAREFLKSLGYFVLNTTEPHIYVMEDFIRQEAATLHQ
jgi:hypothetical protein